MRLPSLPSSATISAQRFTTAWVVALLAIGALAIVGAAVTDDALLQQQRASRLGDLVASQARDLGEISAAVLGKEDADADAALARLQAVHELIVEGDEERAIPALAGDESVAEVQRLTSALGNLERLLGLTPGDRVDIMLAQAIDAANHEYHTEVADLLHRRQTASSDAAARARLLQRSALLATLALLSLLAVLVFGPASRRFRQALNRGGPPDHADLAVLARYDHLTGLANRLLFRDRLEHAIAQAERNGKHVAVLFLDLDKFKDINDQFGHDAGDELLIGIADRLQDTARRADTVGRLGGDEFTVLLEALDEPAGAASVAKKIMEVLREPFPLQGREIHVGTSIGIAVYPGDARDVDELLRHADTAMYQAKNAGRGNFQFSTPELREANVARLHLVDQLRVAIASDRLRLVFQPQISVATGRIDGAEALVRWIREDGTEIPAGQFIGVAEETDLIVPLNRWVIDAACRQIRAWSDAGLRPVRVAVNVSQRQFRQFDLCTLVASSLSNLHIEPHLLDLEITEDALVEDPTEAIATLRLLKTIGVQLTLDDFGTGSTSLGRMRSYPLDSLKIDGSFLAEPGVDRETMAVPAAITNLAHHLGMTTTAEGVERPEHLALLADIGCDYAQGFHILPPVAPDRLAALILEEDTQQQAVTDVSAPPLS